MGRAYPLLILTAAALSATRCCTYSLPRSSLAKAVVADEQNLYISLSEHRGKSLFRRKLVRDING